MTIRINGVIISNNVKWIYDAFNMDSFCPNDLHSQLTDGEDVDIEINSPGGYVYAGSEIYTALIKHKGAVNITITGAAASAASVIAMAGTTLKMSPTAQMMIHNVTAEVKGDYRDMEHAAKFLRGANQTIANAYQLKTGKSYEELLALMDAETWMHPQQALELGFIDEILQPANQQANHLRMVASDLQLIPQNVIDQMNKKREQEELSLLILKDKEIA